LVRGVRRQVLPGSMLSVPVLILGKDGTVERLTRRLESLPELDLAPISGTDDGAAGGPAALDEILRLAGAHGVRQVVVARAVQDENEMVQVAAICHEAGLRVTWLPPTMGLPMRVSSLQLWEGAPVIELVGEGSRQFYEQAKRVLDVVGAGIITLALLPLMAAVAIAIRLDSRGPALIRQARVGRGSRPFQMYKFRSMRTISMEIPEELRRHNEAAGPMFKMRRDPRMTRVGRFIRRASIDELPQLFNVLLGEMSLVGPRPPLPRELPGYDEVQRMRLTVMPGITGMWQVNGRSNLTFEEMLDLDLEYIERRSLALDLLILLRTVPCVLSGRGAC
jgi:exopolysaccharide biosynthesis polyprenyl glycosylphosphotransferase